MDKNFPNLSTAQLQQLASSPAARELMQMLKQNYPSEMDAALSGSKKGDISAVQRSLAAFMTDPKAKELLKQLQEGQHGRNGR